MGRLGLAEERQHNENMYTRLNNKSNKIKNNIAIFQNIIDKEEWDLSKEILDVLTCLNRLDDKVSEVSTSVNVFTMPKRTILYTNILG
jgi:hypothetical protein